MRLAPYGLVAKANRWYLVGSRNDKVRVLTVARIHSASLRPETFERPDDFDLAEFWRTWVDEQENSRSRYRVRARVTPTLARRLALNQGMQMMEPPMRDTEPWPVVKLVYEDLEAARTAVLSYGGACEVLEPLALRRVVEDYAEQTLARYRA
jgi:predicted DNA-binding transcriptional regulator YafY